MAPFHIDVPPCGHPPTDADGNLSDPASRARRGDQDVLLPGRAAITTHWPTFPAARAIATTDAVATTR